MTIFSLRKIALALVTLCVMLVMILYPYGPLGAEFEPESPDATPHIEESSEVIDDGASSDESVNGNANEESAQSDNEQILQTSVVSDTAVDETSTSSVEELVTPIIENSSSTISAEVSASSTNYEYIGSTTEATTTYTEGSTSNEGTDNGSTTSQGATEIVTGTTVALANVLNLVNTNFVNSEGVVVFKNFFDALLDDFDLRDYFNFLSTATCSLSNCSADDVQTNISNGAEINNALFVEAVSGNNTIERSGEATIETGDAYAGVNLINIANTNVIDSNYLLVTMNAFQGVNGDIIFPSLANFLSGIGGVSSQSEVAITNSGSVANNVNLDADSGNNEVTDNGNSTIQTGATQTSANVFNELNTSLVGGQSVSLIFRVHGDWAGEIFGAPENLGWFEDGTGGIYMFDKGGAGMNASTIGIMSTNTASINNNVNVMALTGKNAISGAETALISTGNAYVGANIVNVENATVVGRNWILAIINIFGDFKGNISFGRPDLWVGGQATVPSKVRNESDVKYTLTVINNGDAPSTDVTLVNAYDTNYLDIHDASAAYTTNPEGKMVWDIEDLKPGQATEVSYYGRIKNTARGTDIKNSISVRSRETDNNLIDNSESVIVRTDASSGGGRSGVKISLSSKKTAKGEVLGADEIASDISVERTTSTTTVDKNVLKEVTQHLLIKNNSNKKVPHTVLLDTLYNPEGTIIKSEIWNLGDVLPYEEIKISYTVTFKDSAVTGLYTLGSKIESGGAMLQDYMRNGSIHIIGSAVFAPVFPMTVKPISVIEEVRKEISTDPIVINSEESVFDPISPQVVEAVAFIDESAPVPGTEPRSLLAFAMAILSAFGASVLRQLAFI